MLSLRLKRKIMLFVLVTSIALLCLIGQGMGEEQSNPVTIEFATWNWDNPEHEATWTAAIKEFERQNPNIKVEFQLVQFSQLVAKMKAACQAGNPPDVSMMAIGETATFIKAGYLYDITSWVKRDIDLNDFSEKDYSVTSEGKWYGLPWRRDAYALIYNKDAFEDAGITKWPETIDELFTVIRKLTRDTNGDGKIDQYGYGVVGKKVPGAFQQWINWFSCYGGELFNEEKTAVPDNFIEKATKAFAVNDYLLRNGLADPSAGLNDADENTRLLSIGRIAMLQEMQSTIDQIMEMKPSFELGYGILPRGVEEGEKWWSTMNGGKDMVMYKNAKHPEAAWKFLNFWLSTENQINCAQTNPVRKSALAAKKWEATPEAFRVALSLSHAALSHPIGGDLMLLIQEENEKIVYGVTSPEAAAKETAAKINEWLSKD